MDVMQRSKILKIKFLKFSIFNGEKYSSSGIIQNYLAFTPEKKMWHF